MKIYYKILKYLLAVLLITIGFSSDLKADLDITKNREFILTFLPNYHNNWNSNTPSLIRRDSVYIFIYAEVPTKGTIEYRDRFNNQYVEEFEIPNPSIVYVFKRVSHDFALLGYNISGNMAFDVNITDSEKIRSLSFKVKTDFPVQVYGHSEADMTSESFNVLPVESLGNEYLVLTYNANTDLAGGSRTPSQFAIVAVEDNTSVTIIPSASSYLNGMSEQTINMNAGEVYLVQTDLSPNNPDLTGSRVRSDKPVAVFAGQQRAKVPIDANGSFVSRDYLAEQMPPIDSWSNEAIVVPFQRPSNLESSTTFYDKMRVIAAYDNTELYVDGILFTILNSGEFYESDIRAAMHIKANAPIMAAGYKRSSGISTQITSYRGDPLLQIIPTPNQFGESYRFITIQAYKNFERIYDEHYITIISKPDNTASLRLNGLPIAQNIFAQIQGSEYVYGYIRVGDGTYTLTGDRAFGLFVCGYGYAVSYGYYCGVVVKRDDYEAPELQSSSDCFEIEGLVTDQKLKSITSPDNFRNNVAVEIESFTPYVQSAEFKAELVNRYYDGSFRIVAVDSVGQQTSKDLEIPGFTIALVSELDPGEFRNIKALEDSLTVGEKRCYDYKIINYGKFPQNVNLNGFINNNPTLEINLPATFTLKPGEEIEFEICFYSDEFANIIDTLFIEGDCNKRNILALNLLASKDDVAPQVASFADPCNQFIEIAITDSLRTDKGIDKIEIIESDNIDAEIRKISDNHSVLEAKVKNPNIDSYIKIKVTDKAGNSTEYERAIPGYTIEFDLIKRIDDNNMLLDFGTSQIGIRFCDSVRLTNFGNYEILLDNPRLSQNIRFSLPASQLPLVIEPGEFIDLKICFFANQSDVEEVIDTLTLTYNCLNKFIVLSGQPDSLIFGGDTKCDIPLLFEVAELPETAFIGGIYPNPAGGIVNVDINNPKPQSLNLKIYNTNGAIQKNLDFNLLAAGYYNIPIDVSSLPEGYYIISTMIGSEIFVKSFVIIR
ncbi:MAG: T9SS type A sorting domain-containing protein [Candidatus Kapabacteria bacterium]|nr:T9SS type A sorting domain-containing protein [Ignavibacteriota bacterium]MCW5884196.1 T9SS type A sorting domain-containing protein [Candidatus Kapabacteria bacterium]